MKRPGKRFIKKAAIAIILLTVLSHTTSSCLQFRMNNKEVNKYFQAQPVKPSLKYVTHTDRRIHFADIGYDSLPLVVFFHGAPGSWSAFADFMRDQELLSYARLISVDRPGYGYSDFGNAEISLEKQAHLIKPVLELNQGKIKPILVGHSLGGSLIARIAMDYPDLVGGLVMIAPSGN